MAIELFPWCAIFTGLKLTNKGIIPDSSKVDAVTKAKVPINVTEVRRFLGLVNYYSQFIPGYAESTEPLRKLKKKNTIFKCSSKHQNSFEKLKLALANSQTMAYYIPDAEKKVIVDALPIRLGAILSQEQKTGEFRPVGYTSKALNPAEQRYSQTEKERLAVLWTLKKFHYYICDRVFTVSIILRHDLWYQIKHIGANFGQHTGHVFFEKGTRVLLEQIYEITLRLAFSNRCRCFSFLFKLYLLKKISYL